MDENATTYWRSTSNGTQSVQVDLQGEKAAGGLHIDWAEDFARSYEVDTSVNGLNWSTVYVAANQAGGTHTIRLDETEARFLRIVCRESATGKGYAIRRVELKTPDGEMTPSRFYRIAAQRHPGCYPRWLLNEQAYWTIVGTPQDMREGAIAEDGTLEPHKRGFTIMPLLRVNGRLITRNEARVSQALENDYLPIPSVAWDAGDLDFRVKLFACGGAQSSLYARYTVANRGPGRARGRLFLVIHPMQVYPPWQGGTDGFSPIRSIACENGTVRLDGDRSIALLTKPSAFSAKGGTFQLSGPVEGDIADDVARGELPAGSSAEDPVGFASGAAAYDFDLQPGGSLDVFVAVPLHGRPPELTPDMPPAEIRAQYERMLAETAAYWESQVSRVAIRIPDRRLVNTLKANIAYNLITKDGPGFQPGSRSYDKAWMRDGGSAAVALLRMGFSTEIRDFIEWFAGYQFESGEIPPIIDNKHEDPLWEEKQGLHEFDSQGQFVSTILEYYLYTRDRRFLEDKFPQIVKALQFLAALREKRCTAEYKDGPPEKRIFYGILPESRSHEAYWLAHSYWDDFWALKGWKDGRKIAEILGNDGLASWMQREYEALKDGVYESIRRVMELNRIDHLPGCAEQGDFDAASTAEALVHCDEMENLPRSALRNTFERYYKELLQRLEPGARYVFTPYEMRNVLAFLFMGDKQRALTLFNFMLSCLRPAAWHHLAEVVHGDARFPCYIGDMPHTWVGAEYINSARGLLLYEKGDALVLGAGIDPDWVREGEVISIGNLPTHFGPVSYEMRRAGDTVSARVTGNATPPAGFLLKGPLDRPLRSASLNGTPVAAPAGDGVIFQTLPAEIVFSY